MSNIQFWQTLASILGIHWVRKCRQRKVELIRGFQGHQLCVWLRRWHRLYHDILIDCLAEDSQFVVEILFIILICWWCGVFAIFCNQDTDSILARSPNTSLRWTPRFFCPMTSVRHALEMDTVLEHELKAGPIYRLIFIDGFAWTGELFWSRPWSHQ